MWDAETDVIEEGRVRRVRILRAQSRITFAEAIAAWQEDPTFTAFFTAILAEAPYDAYFWETPPVSRGTADQSFEFVLVESPTLAGMRPSSSAFAEHFAKAAPDSDIAAFANLGGDAFLIAPLPRGAEISYPHLAAFARKGPETQQRAFWRLVGSSLAERLADRPLWLSTSGLGVPWLHVRIDTYPKYYTHAPYRRG